MRRYLLSLWLAAIMVCATFPLAARGLDSAVSHDGAEDEDNLVPNPSFEEGRYTPDGWYHNVPCGPTLYLWDHQHQQEGTMSVGVASVDRECGVSEFYWATKHLIPVSPHNTSYRLAAWYKYVAPPATWPQAFLTLWTYDGSKSYLSTLNLSCPYQDTAWHQKEIMLSPESGASLRLPPDACYVRILLCAGAYSDHLTDAEIRFDHVYFGVIEEKPNTPPHAPSISGPASGETGTAYNYTIAAADPEEDMVYYLIDWGTGSTGHWSGPYPSGEAITRQHAWEEDGNYTIRVKARDSEGAESNWSTLRVSMPLTSSTSPSRTGALLQLLHDWALRLAGRELFPLPHRQ
ncbi:MAG TPA: hypothetical protein ENN54_01050 [Thermoplasmatales archaeon]|nr:hypothetical protein [Thermoplasmatales archaeon]